MTKPKRKSSTSQLYDRDVELRHQYRYLKTQQDRKMMKQLDNTLRSKNFSRLLSKSDDY